MAISLSITKKSKASFSIKSVLASEEISEDEKTVDEVFQQMKEKLSAALLEVVTQKVLLYRSDGLIQQKIDNYLDAIDSSNELVKYYFELMGSDNLNESEVESLIAIGDLELLKEELKVRWLKHHKLMNGFNGLSEKFVAGGFNFPHDVLNRFNELIEMVSDCDCLSGKWNPKKKLFEKEESYISKIQNENQSYANLDTLSDLISCQLLSIALNNLLPNTTLRKSFLESRMLDKDIVGKLSIDGGMSPIDVNIRRFFKDVTSLVIKS